MTTTMGKRVRPPNGSFWLADGDYAKNPRDGLWYARPPGMRMGCLKDHDVTENEDGTITVEQSILIDEGNGKSWHGYLENGVWTEM